MNKQTAAEEQAFLVALEKKLRNSADRLRANLDTAVYKHAVLGLIFLKYISANLHQSCTLATLRDTLLPKLLSGEITVSN